MYCWRCACVLRKIIISIRQGFEAIHKGYKMYTGLENVEKFLNLTLITLRVDFTLP